jgi:hypothetical protein
MSRPEHPKMRLGEPLALSQVGSIFGISSEYVMCVSVEPDSTSSRMVIQVSSVFGVEDARQIDSLLSNADPRADVDVDFREVHEYDGPALAHLVEVIRSGRARVALHGLSGHAWKLLEYLDAQIGSQQDSAARRS